MNSQNDLINECKRFNKIVIWGFKTKFDTFRYIHLGYFTTFKKLGIDVLWLDDEVENNKFINDRDLVFSVDVGGKNLILRNKVYYCLHNFDLTGKTYDENKIINVQVYTNEAEKADEKINKVTFFDNKTNILYQPWGTNLLESEFYRPRTWHHYPHMVFLIGSIWDNDLGQGNIDTLVEYQKILLKRKIFFIPCYNRVPELLSISLMRASRFSPAIAGRWNVANNYLQCRMFKNISYGILGISNVKKFGDLFSGCSVKGNSIEEIIDNALNMSYHQRLSFIDSQQEIVKQHTYVKKLYNIMTYLHRIEDK